MSVLKAIEFSFVAAQLTPAETLSFVQTVAKSDPQLIIDSLSSYFVHLPQTPDNTELNNQYIKSVSTIIQSRESQSEEKTPYAFDSLPRRLIGACSSFLCQRSYTSLSRTNRAVFLGCNTPIMLTELRLYYQPPFASDDSQSLDFSAVPYAKSLSLSFLEDSDQYPQFTETLEFIASGIARMPRLERLRFHDLETSGIIEIIAKQQSANQRIKTLFVELHLWQDDTEEFERFITSITSFKHLQFLDLRVMNMEADGAAHYFPSINDMKLKSLIETCSNLRGLCINDEILGIQPSVLVSIGKQLQYLQLNKYRDRIAMESVLVNIDFSNLRELIQGFDCNDKLVSFILKTAINLEKIKLCAPSELIEQILTKCKRLEYLEIAMRSEKEMESVLKCLERALFQRVFKERDDKTCIKNTLKIRINSYFGIKSHQEGYGYIMTLKRIMNTLSVSEVDQWMIILNYGRMKREGTSTFIGNLRKNVIEDGIQVVIPQSCEEDIVSIANTGCTISGWRESWLMSI